VVYIVWRCFPDGRTLDTDLAGHRLSIVPKRREIEGDRAGEESPEKS
jgi:hypothetical protein